MTLRPQWVAPQRRVRGILAIGPWPWPWMRREKRQGIPATIHHRRWRPADEGPLNQTVGSTR
jgi:hypothetical protein